MVLAGPAAPAYDQPGNSIQYWTSLTNTISEVVDSDAWVAETLAENLMVKGLMRESSPIQWISANEVSDGRGSLELLSLSE